jgi:hypothetical protein
MEQRMTAARGPAAGDSAPASQAAQRERAETYLRLRAEAELRRQLTATPLEPQDWPPIGYGAHQLRIVASALSESEALDEETVGQILTGFETALALRRGEMLHGFMSWHRMRRMHSAQVPPAPAGPIRAIGLGTTVPVEVAGGRGEVVLLAAVFAADRAALAVTARTCGPPRMSGPQVRDPLLELLSGGTAADDRGTSYQLNFTGGGSDDEWTGRLEFSPLPPPSARWLDVTLGSGQPVRLDLAESAAVAAPGPSSPTAMAAYPPGDSPGERYLDLVAENLVRSTVLGGVGRDDLVGLPEVVAGLRAAGVLGGRSPALGRVATVATELGLELPAGLAGAALPAALPEPWADVLAHAHRRDGVSGLARLGAVLPELDGTRCVLAGLESQRHKARLTVLAWGWPFQGPWARLMRHERFRFWARDSMGRWHIGSELNGGTGSDGHADLELELAPPLHPRATSVEVILVGRTRAASVSVGLNWVQRR